MFAFWGCSQHTQEFQCPSTSGVLVALQFVFGQGAVIKVEVQPFG